MTRPSDLKNKHPDSLPADWDASMSAEMMKKRATLDTRRAFLTGLLKSGTMLAAMPAWMALPGCERQSAQQQIVQSEPWQTFAAVQQRLFPDDGNGPSARDIYATVYLKFVLDAADTDEDDRRFVFDGIKWLNALTDTQFGKAFVSLPPASQDKALKKIATSNAGERWLSQLLLYIMEALLTDPIYGGNPQGIGWQWLEHQAGFPQPPKNKIYTELR